MKLLPKEDPPPPGEANTGPKFGLLIIVLLGAVGLVVAITFGSEAWFS